MTRVDRLRRLSLGCALAVFAAAFAPNSAHAVVEIHVVNGDGPCNKERLATRVKAWNDGAWVREAALAHARKQEQRAMKEAA